MAFHPLPMLSPLSHDLTHVQPPPHLSSALILNAMRCTGASRHTHGRGTSTTSVLAGQGHGIRQKREKQAQANLGRVIGSDVRLAPASLALPPPRIGANMAMGMTMGTRRERDKKEDRRWWRGTTAEWARSKNCGTLDS